jgi:hypothetical protein
MTFDSHYYVLTRQYRCGQCEDANKDREKADKVQYLFQGHHAESMKRFKHHIRESYPAVLTHRNAVDKVLADMLRPVTDKGLSFNALQEMLVELHSLRYTRDYMMHQDRLRHINNRRMLELDEPVHDEQLSNFDDSSGYNGAISTAGYLAIFYKLFHRTVKTYMDMEQKFTVDCETLKVDASFKATGKLSRYRGKKVFNCMITLANSHGQIRTQVTTFSDSH